jgi:hypothetical protein
MLGDGITMNINEAVVALHQGVREAVEQFYDCTVTSIGAETETHYAPALGLNPLNLVKEASVLFRVEAQQGLVMLTYRVTVDRTGTLRTLSVETKLG